MLNILVCVKQIPDVDLVKMDPETGNLVRDGVPSLMNPLDTNALEAALQIKERFGGKLTAITMGPPTAADVLRESISVGADEAVLVSGRGFGGADTLSTSYSIAKAAEMLGSFDLIFAGKETLDGATGQMASQLAERFDCSQISCCIEIESIENGVVRAKRQLDSGVQTVEAKLPCLITVEKAGFIPRLPRLNSWLQSKNAPITVLDENNITGLDPQLIGVPGSGTIVPKIYPPQLPEPGQILNEGSITATVNKLVDLLEERGVL